MDVRKTVLVAHSAEQMYDVIEAAEHYPDFLPWCAGAVIVARDESEVVADIQVDYHGIRFGFRTRNPKRRPNWMAIRLERGPFRHLDGVWDLKPLAENACRIDFDLHYEFEITAMAKLARPVFDRIANALVDRFVARADELYAHAMTPVSPSSSSEPALAASDAPTAAGGSALPDADPGTPALPNESVSRSEPP